MKAKNRIGLLAKLLGGGFIVSFAFFMFTNATENPLLLRLRALEIPVKPPPITQISTSAVELKLS